MRQAFIFISISIFIALVAAAPARAEQAMPVSPVIKDTFGFDWHRPKTSKCVKISGAVLRKLENSYVCKPPEIESASGKPLKAVCTTKAKQKSEYLLLGSEADCKEERETQLANG
jgi:hypothetical protein